jgi:hypothetical protein
MSIIRIVMAICVATAAAAAATAADTAGARPAPLQVHLPRTIQVEGDSLSLGLVSVVRAGDEALARKAADIPMGRAPWPREEIVIDRTTILGRLASHGIAAGDVQLSGSDKEKITVQLVDNQVMFACANAVVCSNLVEGNFPKYEDIIPSDYQKKVTLPTDAALSAVRRAALLTSEESRGIKLALTKNKLIFSAKAPETGDAEVDVIVEYTGEPIEIGFNPQFLADAIRVIGEPQFDLELGQADTPGLIKAGANFLYVLMPINLS